MWYIGDPAVCKATAMRPLPQVSKNKQEMAFYSLPEFEEWKSSTPNHKKWKVKYYKGL